MIKKELRDLDNRLVKPMETWVIFTDKFLVRTVHLIKENGMSVCKHDSVGFSMIFREGYKFKKCKRCFK